MIDLKDYAEFWRRAVADALEGAATVLPVTIDRDMGKKIQSLPADSLTLFMLPPMAVSTSRNTDAYQEKCDFVVFLMRKYSPQRVTSWDVLADVLPQVEALKRALLAEYGAPCSRMRLDVSSVETAPETELYGSFAGWSLTFSLIG